MYTYRIIEEDRLLRYLYSGGFDIEKAYQVREINFIFLQLLPDFNFTL